MIASIVAALITPGSDITYSLRVANTGNVTLDVTGITDTMNRINTGAPTFLTTPFGFVTGDTDNDNLLDVDEVWEYSATYRITQSDLNAGGVQNSVEVTAEGPAIKMLEFEISYEVKKCCP